MATLIAYKLSSDSDSNTIVDSFMTCKTLLGKPRKQLKEAEKIIRNSIDLGGFEKITILSLSSLYSRL